MIRQSLPIVGFENQIRIKWFYAIKLRLACCPSYVEFRCRMGSLASMKHTARSQQERREQAAGLLALDLAALGRWRQFDSHSRVCP